MPPFLCLILNEDHQTQLIEIDQSDDDQSSLLYAVEINNSDPPARKSACRCCGNDSSNPRACGKTDAK